jgi:hypothetical protein
MISPGAAAPSAAVGHGTEAQVRVAGNECEGLPNTRTEAGEQIARFGTEVRPFADALDREAIRQPCFEPIEPPPASEAAAGARAACQDLDASSEDRAMRDDEFVVGVPRPALQGGDHQLKLKAPNPQRFGFVFGKACPPGRRRNPDQCQTESEAEQCATRATACRPSRPIINGHAGAGSMAARR